MMVPRIIIVAIDPGHGGKDPGAIGNQGTQEKDVTLAIARKLKERIDKEPNMRAVLTREGDYYITLPQRRINARRANADLFVSIHADANPKSHAHGSSVFTLSEHGATSTTASWLANKENSVDTDLMGGIDITSKSKDIKELLLDLSVNATINDSVKLAEHVLKQLGDINHLHKRNVEQAGFAVLNHRIFHQSWLKPLFSAILRKKKSCATKLTKIKSPMLYLWGSKTTLPIIRH
jgi:N-acetylmuramoyl-L-alanine amidase